MKTEGSTNRLRFFFKSYFFQTSTDSHSSANSQLSSPEKKNAQFPYRVWFKSQPFFFLIMHPWSCTPRGLPKPNSLPRALLVVLLLLVLFLTFLSSSSSSGMFVHWHTLTLTKYQQKITKLTLRRKATFFFEWVCVCVFVFVLLFLLPFFQPGDDVVVSRACLSCTPLMDAGLVSKLAANKNPIGIEFLRPRARPGWKNERYHWAWHYLAGLAWRN